MISFSSSISRTGHTRNDYYSRYELAVPGAVAGIGFGAWGRKYSNEPENIQCYVNALYALENESDVGSGNKIKDTTFNALNNGTTSVSYTGLSNANMCTATVLNGTMAGIAQSVPQLFGKQSASEVTASVVFARLQALYGSQYHAFVMVSSVNLTLNLADAQRTHYSGVEYSGVCYVHTPSATNTRNSIVAIGPDYFPALDIYNTDDKALAWAIYGDYNPERDKLRFDVYLNGADSPAVAVRWDKDQTRPLSISLQTVTPIVWTYPDRNDYTSPDYPGEPIHVVDDVTVVDESFPEVRKNVFTWNGKYQSQYLTIFDNATANLANLTKVVRYGLDGIADQINLYLRFNYSIYENNQGETTWSTLWKVPIKKDTGTTAPTPAVEVNSAKNPQFDTAVYVHLSAPPDEDENDNDNYDDGNNSSIDPGKTVPDFSDGESTGYDGKAVLTKTYAMTASVLENIGTKLWTQSYYDVLKIQDNPIENVVSCKWFPFSLTGTTASVKIGNVDFEINASKINSIYTFDVGSVSYPFDDPDHTYSYLDCSPYVSIKLHLPYCGTVQLDASELYGRSLFIKYVVDIVTGDVAALLYLDKTQNNPGVPYMLVAGHAGVDIPLTASNRQQMEIRHASQTISAVVGAGAHILSGDIGGGAAEAFGGFVNVAGMDYTSQRSAAPTSACTTKMNRDVFIEVSRPGVDADNSEGFKAIHGYPCHKYKNLGYFSGFVKADSRTKITIAMTSEENAELERLLIEGIFV